jgi:hypothetical protein
MGTATARPCSEHLISNLVERKSLREVNAMLDHHSLESESVMPFLDRVIGAFGKRSEASNSKEINLKKRDAIEDSKNCNAGSAAVRMIIKSAENQDDLSFGIKSLPRSRQV